MIPRSCARRSVRLSSTSWYYFGLDEERLAGVGHDWRLWWLLAWEFTRRSIRLGES